MYDVYCLTADSNPTHRCIGFPENFRQRVEDHNAGCNPSTRDSRPWKLKGCIAFDATREALAFERYLKTSSGHVFRKKRPW